MSAWTALTLDVVQNALPSDVNTAYAAWVAANPSKDGRLADLIAEQAAIFRRAVVSGGQDIPEDETLIPIVGFRHAMNMLTFYLLMEIGAVVTPEVYQLVTRADIWMRMLQQGRMIIEPEEFGGTPSYVTRDRSNSDARSILGA